MIHTDRDAAQILFDLGLPIDASDQEIEAAARRANCEAVEDAEEAIREIIRAAKERELR